MKRWPAVHMLFPPPLILIAIVTVGLPARGKTYIARKVTRYLNWLGIETRVFNVGDYRRRFCGAEQRHNFFDAKNAQAEEQRASAAAAALEDMIRWLRETDGQVAIYDATNTTAARRKMISDACTQAGINVSGDRPMIRLLTPNIILQSIGAICGINLQ